MKIFDIRPLTDLTGNDLKEVHELMYYLERDQTGTPNPSVRKGSDYNDLKIGTHQYVYVERDTSKVVSFACFIYDQNEERHIITISTLTTHPDYRHRGLTQFFVKGCMRLMREQSTVPNLKEASVLVERYKDNQDAEGFYNSIGLKNVFNEMIQMHGSLNI